MCLRFDPFTSHYKARGFSLVEMLVVIAIMAILALAAAPMIAGVMRSYQLDSAGQLVINQLVQARQKAIAGNHAVQVWFFELPDYNQSSSATPATWRAMQAFSEGDPPASGNPPLTPVTKPIFFPVPVVISNAQSPKAISPLLPATPSVPDSTCPVLPNYQINYKYTCFRFRPDGTTDLSAPANSLTLILENASVQSTGLPSNYQTLLIDPIIGTVRSYRP